MGDRYIKAAELWDEYEESLKTKFDPAVLKSLPSAVLVL